MHYYENDVRSIVKKILKSKDVNAGFVEDLQQYGLDSINCILLIIELEEYFDITIPEEKLGLVNVRNIKDICDLITEVKSGQ